MNWNPTRRELGGLIIGAPLARLAASLPYFRDERIKHIVVLMMENRSFDHMLGLLPNPEIRGIRGGTFTNPDPAMPSGVLTVQAGAAYQGQLTDPGHTFDEVHQQIFGPKTSEAQPPYMQGFAQSYYNVGGDPQDVLRCFEPEQLPVLTTLANNYAVCDQWFSSVPGPTQPNRAFAHFGTSFGYTDESNDYARVPGPSIYERLRAVKHASKVFYQDNSLIQTVLLTNQHEYFGYLHDFERACKRGTLPSYSFVEPRYFTDLRANLLATDQHPPNNVLDGDAFIGQIYRAVSGNADLFASTLLILVWDEHGGLYDHVLPPPVTPDSFTAPNFAFDRLGVRVPAVVISPYIEKGVVCHRTYEHASIPATVTESFIGSPAEFSPYPREKAATTVTHLLTRRTPRTDTITFPPPAASRVASGQTAASIGDQPAVVSDAMLPAIDPVEEPRLSSLQRSILRSCHTLLRTHCPTAAATVDVEAIATSSEASAFVTAADRLLRDVWSKRRHG